MKLYSVYVFVGVLWTLAIPFCAALLVTHGTTAVRRVFNTQGNDILGSRYNVYGLMARVCVVHLALT